MYSRIRTVGYQFLWIVSLFLFIECSLNTDTNVKYIKLVKMDSIETIAGRYFSRINDIQEKNNEFYIVDSDRNQILRTDKNFNLINTIGNFGNGPGEFKEIRRFDFFNDSLIIDNLRYKFEIYSLTGTYLRTIGLISPNVAAKDFSVYKNYLFYSANGLKNPITRIDLNNTEEQIEIDHQLRDTINLHPIKDQLVLINYENRICGIGSYKPVIHIYDSNGNPLLSVDYSNFEYIDKFIEVSAQRVLKNPKSVTHWARNAKIWEDFLYVLVVGFDYDNKYEQNSIIKINCKKDFRLEEFIKLGSGEIYHNFEIDYPYILAFDEHSSSIHKYKLE